MAQAKSSIPRISPKSRQYVEQVLGFGFHNTSSVGMSGRLEKEFAVKFGVKYGILHANGTTTMHSALLAADVGVGDEVIVPALTIASTALVAVYVNAIPIFADVHPETFTIAVDDVRRKITPRTKAIIPVFYKLSQMVAENPKRWPHYAGMLPDYRKAVCPVLERIQPHLIQLKTNYFDLDTARRQADILAQTIRFFE